MDVPAHWTRVGVDLEGREDPRGPAIAFGWSSESPEAAHAHGLGRARSVAARLAADRDGDLRRTWQYYPLERPLCEPVLEWVEVGGARAAVLTRNAYGAVVLNTTRAAFVDLDLPRVPPAGWLARLVGGRPPPVPDPVPARVAAVVGRRPDLGLRLYRTAAGYRALVTSAPISPVDALPLLRQLEADPLYVRLTEVQDCFRARLTPKPFRIGLPSPQTQYFPWTDERRARFAAWLADYERTRTAWAVCRPVAPFGRADVHPEVAPILALHDRWCCTPGALA